LLESFQSFIWKLQKYKRQLWKTCKLVKNSCFKRRSLWKTLKKASSNSTGPGSQKTFEKAKTNRFEHSKAWKLNPKVIVEFVKRHRRYSILKRLFDKFLQNTDVYSIFEYMMFFWKKVFKLRIRIVWYSNILNSNANSRALY
jgi:hypothetical protein